MTISMYDASIPAFLLTLKNLKGILQKALAHAEAKKFDPNILAAARLAPDMFALTRQVQIAADSAKFAASRLTGIDAPKFDDTETTLPELMARIDKTIDFLKSVKPEQFEGSETRTVEIKTRGTTLTFNGLQYLRHWALPNFYFHVTTTYGLLRHNGVDLGKTDYLGEVR